MKSHLLQNELDIQGILDFINRLPYPSNFADLNENLLLASVRETARIWRQDGHIVGFAFIDDYNNLIFETVPDYPLVQLENEIIEWGVVCMEKRNIETCSNDTLDYSCNSSNQQRIALIEKYGFERQSMRTLRYERSLSQPITEHPFPPGFSLHCVEGEHEVDRLVALHRAAFGTENMTIEQRLAIMHAPGYDRKLDFAAIAPNGDYSAFCICGIKENLANVGYVDPIGTHPRYQRLGLAKAIVTAGFQALKIRGVEIVETGTSSENIAMQRLAEALGFVCVSENLWFSKTITSETGN